MEQCNTIRSGGQWSTILVIKDRPSTVVGDRTSITKQNKTKYYRTSITKLALYMH